MNNRRRALAAVIGCPPTPEEMATYPLCRQTGISHTHLLQIMSRCNGSYRLFLSEIGLKHHHVADNAYWLPLLKYIYAYLTEWESKLHMALKELALLPDDERKEKEEQYARALGLPITFLQDWLPNSPELKQIVEDIKPDIVAKAKMNIYSAIAAGDVKASFEFVKMEAALAAVNKDSEDNEVIIRYAD